ncbi:hypothetical protein [Oceanithermus profundus]|nr:hypothetical protein [Oceanithermus profundus]
MGAVADWIVALATLALATFAAAQIWLSRKQSEDNSRQLALLRDQTELLRRQTELIVKARQPKVSVRLLKTDEHPYVRGYVRNDGLYPVTWYGGFVAPWPEGVADPSELKMEKPFGIPSLEPHRECRGRTLEEDDLLVLRPNEEWCFDLIGADNILYHYRKNPMNDKVRLAVVLMVGYPPSPTGTVHIIYPANFYMPPDSDRFSILVLPRTPLYVDGEREIEP